MYCSFNALKNDGNNGLWIGCYGGFLSYLNVSGEITYYTNDNSELPDGPNVTALEIDSSGGLWIGTDQWYDNVEKNYGGGLAYRSVSGEWTVYTTDNSGLPDNQISVLESDGNGGLWIGTYYDGLAYYSVSGKWTVYTTDNSGLPYDDINALESDGSGGLWIGTDFGGGLAHITFSQKPTICTHVNEADCNDITISERAAILIHPNGSGTGYNQELAIDFMATYAYKTLQARGYDNDEIYFLSYKPDLDFNANAQADSIVDAPVTLTELRNGTNKPRDITLENIKKAFEWAKNKGKLDQPLVVIFVDHGLPNELLLDPMGTEKLTAETFKALLDDYQNSIKDQEVIVILEACHSGTFVETLSAPNRLIISSTNTELAYFSDYGRTSFLKLYFDNLRRGESFVKSIQLVTDVINTYNWPLNQQRPQFDDKTITANLCLNGCWGGLPGELILMPEKFPDTLNLGQSLDLKVQTSATGVSIKQLWASVITPEIANQRNEQGYSLQPAPFIPLSFQSINTRKNDEKWQGNFSKFTTPGDYVVTFKAEDNNGFITDAPPITLTVAGEGLTHANFDATSNIVHIPAVTVGTDIYQADLLVRQFEPSIILEVDMNSLKFADDTTTVGYSNFSPITGEVYIPLLEVPNATGGIDTYSVNLQLEPQASPLQFKVKAIR